MAHLCGCCLELLRSCDGRYQCPRCPAKFEYPNHLEMHCKTHLPKFVQCPFCPKEFRTSANVLDHIETGTCPGAEGKERSRQMIYIRANRFCLYRANGAIQLRGVPEYPYECPDCHQFFREGSQALQHQEEKHNYLPPHPLSHYGDDEDY